MPIQYLVLNYLKYNKGKGFICGHVDALHAAPPAADCFTDKIIEGLIKKIGCAGIISTVSRMVCDLNRTPNKDNLEGILEYRKAIKDIIDYLHIVDPASKMLTTPYLHISFHGMKDTHHGSYAIEVGTLKGRSCTKEVRKWFEEILQRKAREFSPKITIVFDKKFKGNESILSHRFGDSLDYLGYGQNFNSLQLELSRSIRRKYTPQLINIFNDILLDFQTTFVTKNMY